MGQTPSSHKISARDRAILDLKTQRDRLTQHQRRLTALSSSLQLRAHHALASDPPNRTLALQALRTRRFHENLLLRSTEQLLALEQLVAQVEFAAVQVAVVEGLRQGTAVLRELNRVVGGREGVERVLEENEEERARAGEVGDLIGGLGALSQVDDGEVDEELERMAAEEGLKGGRVEGDGEQVTLRLPDAPRESLVDPAVPAVLSDPNHGRVALPAS